ncbi:SRPBCC family protein [Nocardiopsis alba]|jgi:aromatase|uniref:SRPBCC family protein n=1 Tax=Nocardiopsis alba TaxID=53437 RepID=UPI0033A6BF51
MSARTANAIVIDAPFDLVWEMTNDVASWPNLFTEYASAEILRAKDDWVRFRLTLFPDEEGRVWSWVSERVMDRENASVRAHRVETGPFEYMNLYWTYREVEGGIELRWEQDFHVKDIMPFDDEAMAEHINKNSVEQLRHIKARVEKEANARADLVRGATG